MAKLNIYHTKQGFIDAEQEICNSLGYPNETTEKYQNERQVLINGELRWIMVKHPNIEVPFDEELEFSEKWIPCVDGVPEKIEKESR